MYTSYTQRKKDFIYIIDSHTSPKNLTQFSKLEPRGLSFKREVKFSLLTQGGPTLLKGWSSILVRKHNFYSREDKVH